MNHYLTVLIKIWPTPLETGPEEIAIKVPPMENHVKFIFIDQYTRLCPDEIVREKSEFGPCYHL